MAYYNEKQLQNIKKGLEYAKSNPDNPKSQEITKRLKAGQLNFELKALGLNPVPIEQKVDIQKAMPAQMQGQQSYLPGEEPIDELSDVFSKGVFTKESRQDLVGDVKETFQGVGQTLNERIDRTGEVMRDQDFNILQKIMGTTGQLAGGVADIIGETTIGAGKAFLSEQAERGIKNIVQGVAEDVSETQIAQNVVQWYDGLGKDEKLIVDSVGGVAALIGEVIGLKGAGKATKATTEAIGEAAPKVAKAGQETLETGARRVGTAIDNYSAKKQTKRIETQKGKVNTAVEDILRSGDDPKAIEAGKRVLSSIDRSDIETYKDLQNKTQDRLKALAEKQNELLSSFDQKFSADDLIKRTDVDGTTVEQNFIDSALSQLVKHFESIDDPVQAAKYRQIAQKMESDGLSASELNQIAKDHGRKLTGFNASGELASGLNKQAYENTRKGVKETLRSNIEKVADKETRAKTEALDAAMSDIYKVQPLIDKMSEMVARQRQRTFKPTVAERLKEKGISLANVATLGSVERMWPRALPGARINQSLNYAESEKLLKRNLQRLEALDEIKDDTKYADALVNYIKNVQPGMSIRKTVRPDKVAQGMAVEDFRNVTKIIDEPYLRYQYEDMLDGMGLKNATDEELVSFLKEVVDEYEGVAERAITTQ